MILEARLDEASVNEPLILAFVNPRITEALVPSEPLICVAI